MKNMNKVKCKAEKQRLKALKEYYKAYVSGYITIEGKRVKCIVLAKYRVRNEFYFVVQDVHGNLHIQKLVYNDRVCIVDVSKEGRQYNKNRSVFDTWIETAKKKRNEWLDFFYD